MLMLRRIITIAESNRSCNITRNSETLAIWCECASSSSVSSSSTTLLSSCTVVGCQRLNLPIQIDANGCHCRRAYKICKNFITSKYLLLFSFILSVGRCHLFHIDDRSHTNVLGQRNGWWQREELNQEKITTTSTTNTMDLEIYKRMSMKHIKHSRSTTSKLNRILCCSILMPTDTRAHTHTQARTEYTILPHNFEFGRENESIYNMCCCCRCYR